MPTDAFDLPLPHGTAAATDRPSWRLLRQQTLEVAWAPNGEVEVRYYDAAEGVTYIYLGTLEVDADAPPRTGADGSLRVRLGRVDRDGVTAHRFADE
ncbi:hypothetical protein ACMA1D_10750 [Streptomyces sp. 796.1]|uniref:hypothetical protein n=1 Tax=Streptomyces sp. 796.1 TaxID=3163029 RepID=UPI0039C92808